MKSEASSKRSISTPCCTPLQDRQVGGQHAVGSRAGHVPCAAKQPSGQPPRPLHWALRLPHRLQSCTEFTQTCTARVQVHPPTHRPVSRYTTSSVATLPVAPCAYGQPPSPATAREEVAPAQLPCCARGALAKTGSMPPRYCNSVPDTQPPTHPHFAGRHTAKQARTRGVDHAHAQLQRRQDVGQCLAVRIVHVGRQPLGGHPRVDAGLEHGRH